VEDGVPTLDTMIHLDMLRDGHKRRGLAARVSKAVTVLMGRGDLYGLEWGDPEEVPPLKYFRDHFLKPYVSSDATVIEIGPGGGRWTRYMLSAKRLYAIDYHQELLGELKRNISSRSIVYVKNSGDDFPNIPEGSIDFVFSFGTFVHLDVKIIERYLQNLKPLLKPTSNVVIQYSDKTKPLAAINSGFSENDPERMRSVLSECGYEIYEEDEKTMWHSSIVRCGLPRGGM
jgi:hypothetical protein